MMVNRKKIGNEYESGLALLLKSKGYWCHLFSYNKNGQPCDVIAIKKDRAFLIDAKHSVSDRFSLARIEPNQRTCFRYAKNVCGVDNCGFAIWFESIGKFKWLPYEDRLDSLSSVSKDEMRDLGEVL